MCYGSLLYLVIQNGWVIWAVFDSEEEAITARDHYALRNVGEFRIVAVEE